MSDTFSTPLGPVKTTTLYAVVSSSGDLIRGVGAVDVEKAPSPCGQYTVTFNVDVSLGCYTATTNSADNPNRHGKMYALVAPAGSNSVVVNLFNQNGDSRDQGFFLTVTLAYGETDMT